MCPLRTDHVLGVYDGHGGGACALVTAARLPSYIAASLLDRDRLLEHLQRLETGSDTQHSLLERCNATPINSPQLEQVHERSYTE